jgi:hypothetical protein
MELFVIKGSNITAPLELKIRYQGMLGNFSTRPGEFFPATGKN